MGNFGIKIKDLRKKAGYSQKDFAHKLGISAPNLSQWESMAQPPLDGIIRICNELEIELWEFFLDEGEKIKISMPPWIKDEHMEFLEELSSLPEHVQNQLLEHFKGIITIRKTV